MLIYKVENKVNGKVYIGKTINSLHERKLSHFQSSKDGSNTIFHNSIRKHGKENFEWSVLTEIDNEPKLNALEKFYIMAYRKMGIVYNMTDGGEGASGIKKSEETLKKLSESLKGKNKRPCSEEKKIKISQKLKGRKIPEESLKKRIESQTGKKRSDATREKISKSKMGHAVSIETRIKISETFRNKKKAISEQTGA